VSAKVPGGRARVIVEVGIASLDPLALAAAAQLALSGGIDLATLFVEDINLLRLAELPFALEIGTTSATPRRLVVSDVERALKSRAEETRRALSEMAEALQLGLTFEVLRGHPARTLLEVSSEDDLVVLAGTVVRTVTHTTATGLVRRALRTTSPAAKSRSAQPVAAALFSRPTAIRALAAAHRLAQANASDLILFLPELDPRNDELFGAVKNWLTEHGTTARVTLLRDLTPTAVAELVAARNPRALFWPGDGEMEVGTDVEALLGVISCPLIVVR
jgi:hypothetical protein